MSFVIPLSSKRKRRQQDRSVHPGEGLAGGVAGCPSSGALIIVKGTACRVPIQLGMPIVFESKA